MGRVAGLYYKGVYYDVGTVVKLRTKWNKEVITTFLGGHKYEGVSPYDCYFLDPPETYIIEIIKPVYYVPSKGGSSMTRSGSGSSTSSDEIAIGLIWYIAVMLVAIIFKDRLLIWIVATIIFFAGKYTK